MKNLKRRFFSPSQSELAFDIAERIAVVACRVRFCGRRGFARSIFFDLASELTAIQLEMRRLAGPTRQEALEMFRDVDSTIPTTGYYAAPPANYEPFESAIAALSKLGASQIDEVDTVPR